jgi:ribonuclease HI
MITIPVIKINHNNKIIPINFTEYVLHFDGCSKGNPGPAGIGAVIFKNNKEIWSSCKFIGDNKTNNESEYTALIKGLEGAIKLNITELTVCGDSLLVINQINGLYKVKSQKLFDLYDKVIALKNNFQYISFHHVYRKDNKRADELSNLALISVSSQDKVEDDLQIIDLDEDWKQDNLVSLKVNAKYKNVSKLFLKTSIKQFLPPIDNKSS